MSLTRTEDQGVDSKFAIWRGDGISVQIDYGLFSDPLQSYGNRTNAKLVHEEIDGHPARIVSYDRNDDTHFVGVHFPDLRELSAGGLKKLTAVVLTGPEIGADVALNMLRSIKFSREKRRGEPNG